MTDTRTLDTKTTILSSDQIIDFDNKSKMKLSSAFSKLIGEEFNFKNVLLKAQKAAISNYPILIIGESGTGKEILAHTIHMTSHRRKKKIVDINCAAIPDQLIDSELFGYEKGAFTGALQGGRNGLFLEANKGTLFLDEIADASLQTQAKLLRVLNEGYFKRIGSMKNINIDVRIISATNKNLLQMIEENHFRHDLMYRLNTITLNLPSLRERPNDIPLLSNFFLKQHSKKSNTTFKLSEGCSEILNSYHWPGNVRELKGVIDYMVTMTTEAMIKPNHLPDFFLNQKKLNFEDPIYLMTNFKTNNNCGLLAKAVQQTEKTVISYVLQKTKNRSEAIKKLGTSRRTFYSKLKQYDIK